MYNIQHSSTKLSSHPPNPKYVLLLQDPSQKKTAEAKVAGWLAGWLAGWACQRKG